MFNCKANNIKNVLLYCFVLSWIENLRLSSKHFYFGIYGNLFIANSELGWFSVGNFNQIKQDWLEKHSFIEKRSKQEILPRTPAFAQSIIFCLEYQTYENSVRRCFYEKIISFRAQQVRWFRQFRWKSIRSCFFMKR